MSNDDQSPDTLKYTVNRLCEKVDDTVSHHPSIDIAMPAFQLFPHAEGCNDMRKILSQRIDEELDQIEYWTKLQTRQQESKV